MKPRQTVTKSHALLERIAKRDVISEEQILSDQALLELFSWHTKRAPRARIKDTLAVLVRQGTISQGTIDGQRLYKITSKGRAGLDVVAVRAQNPVTPTTWNGRWFFVTYQIPETHKSARNQLLIELKPSNFAGLGKSFPKTSGKSFGVICNAPEVSTGFIKSTACSLVKSLSFHIILYTSAKTTTKNTNASKNILIILFIFISMKR
jgi:hypothetical protein